MTADDPTDFAYVPFEESASPAKKRGYWEAAIGLQRVDGLAPSAYLLDLAGKNIGGELSLAQTGSSIRHYYREAPLGSAFAGEGGETGGQREADLVSQRIVEVLSSRAFALIPEMLKTIHARLFQDLGESYLPGIYKQVALVKPEAILNGDSVLYADPSLVVRSLAYLFEEERQSPLDLAFGPDALSRFTRFIARLWQVHPFVEGNTRACAVFAELYLDHLGFDVTNDPFKEHAPYFRDALVRANYRNAKAGIAPEMSFLEGFFRNLLFGEPQEFDRAGLACQALFDHPELLRNISPQ
ncbi:MAG: Fic family protein [Eggerthellaceae bacterium]|nr:Fic family protein [Eggerthellaceae bacterium]